MMSLPNYEKKETQDFQKECHAKAKDDTDEVFGTSKSRAAMACIRRYSCSNPGDTIAFLFLVLGIVVATFNPLLGDLLIGMIAGFYFTEELIRSLRQVKAYVQKEGLMRSLIPIGVILGVFIGIPALCIAAIIVAGVKYIFVPEAK